jgi:hypothetical protein
LHTKWAAAQPSETNVDTVCVAAAQQCCRHCRRQAAGRPACSSQGRDHQTRCRNAVRGQAIGSSPKHCAMRPAILPVGDSRQLVKGRFVAAQPQRHNSHSACPCERAHRLQVRASVHARP